MSSLTVACSSSNMNSASARASSVLPTPVGPRKTKEPIGRFGSCRPVRARRRPFASRPAPSALAGSPPVQPVLHLDELLGLALQKPVDGDAGPARHDGGDVVLVHLFLDHRAGLLPVALLELLLERGQLAVADL